MKFTFVIHAVISMHTDVEADSLEKAIEIAHGRGPMSLCHQCNGGDRDFKEEWKSELDTDPAAGKLIDLYVGGDLEADVSTMRKAQKLWKAGQ